MAGRLRRIFESIAYAGMKPNPPSEGPEGGKRGGPRELLDRLLNGRAPSDPFYLTNRTWKQKLRFGLVIGIPCLLLAGGVALGLSHLWAPKTAPPKEPTAAEIVAHLLPDLEKTVDLTPREAEIQDLHPDTTGSPKIIGTLKNNTDRTISVEFRVALTDIHGSKLDEVTERVEKAPAKTAVPFEFPIVDENAAIAVVRSLRVVN
jgi:hypothetical protein